MTLQITQTTDGKYVGNSITFVDQSTPIEVGEDLEFQVEKVLDLGGGAWRFSNSNYIMDCVEV